MFHTYSCYARGIDMVNGGYQFLDLVPKGRHEDGFEFSMEWVRRHNAAPCAPSKHATILGRVR